MKSIDIAIPVYYGNIPYIEESIKKQIKFYNKNLNDYKWSIVLAINGPDKGIIKFANNIIKKYENTRYTYTNVHGKGAGIKACWRESNADIVSYMDVDLATSIERFPELINAVNREYDLSLGSKYLPDSRIARGIRGRNLISKVYHTVFTNLILGIKTSDVHCGFKAMKKESFNQIYPLLKDDEWFFDTELMFFATKEGLKIKEIPIVWTDTRLLSGVKLYRTMIKFIFNIIRLKFTFKL